MSHQPYQSEWDRSEMFAIGAAAGAVITAAISEYLERRNRPKSKLEQVQAALAETRKATSKRAQRYADVASDYVRDTKKQARKRMKHARRDTPDLKDLATAALGLGAAAGVVDKVRDYASSASERVIGDPYAVSGSLRETLKERFGSDGGGRLSERAREVGGSTLEALKEYTSSARETIKDAELSDKARALGAVTAGTVAEYTATAREKLRDAHLADKARDYSSTLAETVKEYGSSARETLKEAKLGDRAREYAEALREAKLGEKAKDYAALAGAAAATYGTTASKAAKQSAEKLSEGASHLASATGEQVADVRKSVRKSVKRTRRRTRWGLRAFVVGLVVGLLTAPQSGERTREAVTSFVENLLDIFMPEESQPGRASL